MAQRITMAVNQTQLANQLRIDAPRLAWATDQGIVHRIEGTKDYDLDSAVGEWLEYERRKRETSKRRSALEREKAALTKARRELVQLRLSTLRGEMVNVNETAGALKASCLRIRSRLQAALPRIARGCYYAQSVDEASRKVRSEFDLLMAELSALRQSGAHVGDTVRSGPKRQWRSRHQLNRGLEFCASVSRPSKVPAGSTAISCAGPELSTISLVPCGEFQELGWALLRFDDICLRCTPCRFPQIAEGKKPYH